MEHKVKNKITKNKIIMFSIFSFINVVFGVVLNNLGGALSIEMAMFVGFLAGIE
jgi:hypothetical protein